MRAGVLVSNEYKRRRDIELELTLSSSLPCRSDVCACSALIWIASVSYFSFACHGARASQLGAAEGKWTGRGGTCLDDVRALIEQVLPQLLDVLLLLHAWKM